MKKSEILDQILEKNNGFLKTSDAVLAGVSRTYLGEYVQMNELERVAQGLYMSQDAWLDGMYVIQTRYPTAVFSHETALYLLNFAEREPVRYSVTLKAGTNPMGLTGQGVKVYTIKDELFRMGVISANTPAGHRVRTYNLERTLCDLVRSRKRIDPQSLQEAIRGYMRSNEKNFPLLLRYAKRFSVEKMIRQYMEVLLP
jgi:predicted transcriptional regulator of viral defense system